MVGSVRDLLPQGALSQITGAGMVTRELEEALEAIRALAESRKPGALGQILAIAMDALKPKRV